MQITFDPRQLSAKDAAQLADFILRFHGYRPDATASPAPTAYDEPAPDPVAPAPAAAPALIAGIEVDADGLPWDERIHSGAKTKNADGTWRAKKGLNDPGLVKSVEAELRARLAAASAPAQSSFLDAPGVPAAVQREIPPAPFVPNAVPPAVPTPGPSLPTPQLASPPTPGVATTASPSSLSFQDVMRHLTHMLSNVPNSKAHVDTACANVGVNSLMDLAVRSDLVPYFTSNLADLLKTNGLDEYARLFTGA